MSGELSPCVVHTTDLDRLLQRYQSLPVPALEELIDETERTLGLLVTLRDRALSADLQPGTPRAVRASQVVPDRHAPPRALQQVLGFLAAYGPATTDTIRQQLGFDRDVIAGLLWSSPEAQRTVSGHWQLTRPESH